MERKEGVEPAGDADETLIRNRARATGAPPPRFDDEALNHARPAEPLRASRPAPVRPRQSLVPALAVAGIVAAAVLVGAALGGFLFTRRPSGDTSTTRPPTFTTNQGMITPESTTAARSDAKGTQSAPPVVANNHNVPSENVPAESAASIPATRQPTLRTETRSGAEREAVARSQRNDDVVEGERVKTEATTNEADAPGAGESQTELRGALGEWVAATNARDVDGQMRFYDNALNAYYLTRNASRAAVRAEKARVLGRADSVDVRAGEPDIKVSPDGKTATMRFRKRYAIENRGANRRGEVLQELRWRRTRDGWRIVGERDLRVIN